MNDWKRIDDGSNVTNAGYRTIIHKTFVMNSGKHMQADVQDEQNNAAAAVIALDVNNQVIIARQFRCGPERVLDEIPGGLIDSGETPEEAVMRELREEVGYETSTIVYLGKSFLNAWSNTTHHYFFAEGCVKTDLSRHMDEFEEIDVKLISIATLIDNAKNARMTDMQSVLLAYDRLKELEKEHE